ncbi:DUF3761 domain-containing protein [Prescottella defluvii]|nr:DUF3761 domain-containing protein [Prescottella defluvii]
MNHHCDVDGTTDDNDCLADDQHNDDYGCADDHDECRAGTCPGVGPFDRGRGCPLFAPAPASAHAPAPAPAPAAVPAPAPSPAPSGTGGGGTGGGWGCGEGYYENSAGNCVRSPGSDSGGASAQCKDGTYSYSQSRRGTCSGHGGVAVWF